jgi:hypothetical protein
MNNNVQRVNAGFPKTGHICGMTEILTEFERVLYLQSKCQLHSYDTTFQLLGVAGY